MVGDWTTDRPRRPAHAVRGEAVHADPAGPAADRPPVRRGPPAARGGEHGRGLAGEHPPPLRPVQRAVRHVPRRDDVLLVGLVRATAATTSPTPSAARSTAILDLAGVRVRPAHPGDRHRLGRAGHPGRAARRPGHHADHLRGAGTAWPSSGCAEAGVADRVQVLLRDYREAQGSYDAVGQRRDDRGGRRAATGRRTSPRWTGCSSRAAGSGCSRSRCRTTGCWSPAATTPGSTSTSSPAG